VTPASCPSSLAEDSSASELSELQSRYSSLLSHSLELERLVQRLRQEKAVRADRGREHDDDDEDRPSSVLEEMNGSIAVR
jgi:hypothetical protein